jgi:hypothetical protein
MRGEIHVIIAAKKGRRIGSFEEILPRGFQRRKNCRPEEVMAVSNVIMILQQQYNQHQHNPIKTRSTVIAIKEREEHHGGNVWIEQYEHIIFPTRHSWRKEERGISSESTVCSMSKL